MNRKKKLRLYQIFFFISGLIIILFTYLKTIENKQDKIISKNTKQKIEKQLKNQNKENSNTFYNIKYSGIDLEGNRYNIESKEGSTSDQNVNIVKMKGVYATFYFKDNTVLRISSDLGDYNNKTLDIIFRKNVRAMYENSELFAEKAEFSNSGNYLKVSENVKIMKYLLRGNVNVNAENSNEWTPLGRAAMYGFEEGVRLLLAHPDIEVNYGVGDRNPLHLAIENKHFRIAALLRQAGAVEPSRRRLAVPGSWPSVTSWW